MHAPPSKKGVPACQPKLIPDLESVIVRDRFGELRPAGSQSLRREMKPEVALSVRAETAFVPLAVAFVENAAAAFGLEREDVLGLTLATEEIFAYLCSSGVPHEPVEIRCLGGVYYVQVQFLFQAEDFNMRAFNLTAAPDLQEEQRLEETGLLIASRMVDHFDFSAVDAKGQSLILMKEKTYPAVTDVPAVDARPLTAFSIRKPDPEELKMFARLVNRYYAGHIVPPFLRFPGKVADMAGSGDYAASLAVDSVGQIGGGIMWRVAGLKIVECCGPYMFNQVPGSGLAEALANSCIEAIARTDAVGLLNRYPTPEVPDGYFERLGSLSYRKSEHAPSELTVLYRQLVEDPGATVWSHPDLEKFLADQYQRLYLARRIQPVRSEGEATALSSVLSAEFDRTNGLVTLRPVVAGADAEENLARHVEVLEQENLTGILVSLDLGKPWQSAFVPALLKQSFLPRIVMPYAGKGDLVLFQHSKGDLPV